MSNRASKAARSVAVALALTGSALAVGSNASGQDTVTFGPPDVGVVRLHLGEQDFVRFDPADGSGGYTNGTPAPITTKGCTATVSGALAIMTPPRTSLGLFADGLGVQAKREGNGQPCGRVDGVQQWLDITLAGEAANYEMDLAELDIEGKFNVVVLADLYLDGVLVGTEELATGSGSDSGPDSGDGDNFRWRIPASGRLVFDRLVLRVSPDTPDGAFSLEGGADGTTAESLGTSLGTNDSLLHVVDGGGVLDCGDVVTAGDEGTPDAELTRLENTSGTSEECEPIPFLLRTDADGGAQLVELLKDLGDQSQFGPAFTLSVVWEPEPATNPVDATEIDYGDGDGPQPIQWCGGTGDEPELPENQLWCLTSQSARLAGDGTIVVSESFYGAGDPRFTR